MTAQQLHTRVAQNGVTLANDGNTDYGNGKVVITGGGVDFDPFNTSDTIQTVINGQVYYGGSLSDDFMVGQKWYNVQVKSLVNGYNRPADAEVDVVLTLDSTGTTALNQGAFDSWHNNLEIIGDQDINFTGVVKLGMDLGVPTTPFNVDFSALEGEVHNFTLDNFELLAQGGSIVGNANNGYAAEVLINIAADDYEGTGSDADPSNGVGWDEPDADSLVSSGVSRYVVTVIDGPTAAGSEGNEATIKLCDTAKDIEVFALRGNYNDTLIIEDAAWGLAFELQGGGTAKSEGPTGTANVGELVANYEWDHADAVVTLTHSLAGDTRPIHAAGIEINNADSITINADGPAATIDCLDGDSVTTLGVNADGNVLIDNELPDALTLINAAGVAGTFSAIIDSPDGAFHFIGAQAGSTLYLQELNAGASLEGETTAAGTIIDGGDAGVVLKIGDIGNENWSGDDNVDLTGATLINVTSVVLADEANLKMTVAQASEIGAANFIIADFDTATLTLVGLDGELLVVPAFDSDINIVLASLADMDVVTLHPDTDLTGISALVVAEGTTLELSAEQFQQLTGDGTITGKGSVHITGLTQAEVGAKGEDFDLDDIDLTGDDSTLTISLAESVDLSDADIYSSYNDDPRVDVFNVGAGMKLTLGDIQNANGVDVNGGANSTLEFTDLTGFLQTIDASGFDVDFLRITNLLVSGNNVDYMFAGLSERVTKVIYNDLGQVEGRIQNVIIEPGTTILGDISFNEYGLDSEITNLVLNMEGGTEIDGDLVISTVEVNWEDDNLIPFYLDELEINSTGTAANLLNGETANVITGDITPLAYPPAAWFGSRDNNLKNVTINADQKFILEGDVVFNSHGDDEGPWSPDDGITANDDNAATVTLEVNGTADVTIQQLDISDEDIDTLVVANNGTGTLTITGASPAIVTSDETENIVFTGHRRHRARREPGCQHRVRHRKHHPLPDRRRRTLRRPRSRRRHRRRPDRLYLYLGDRRHHAEPLRMPL